MKHMLTLSAAALTVLLSAVSVQANDEDADASTPKPLGEEACFPADGILETLAKFDSLKAKRRDTVGPEIAIQLDFDDGELPPQQVEIRDEDLVVPITFDDDYRSVGLTDHLRAVDEGAELCVVDPDRAGRMPSDRGYRFDIGMGVRFKDASGTHSLETIEDGLKDGRSHYKKMVGAMGFMVPKFDHIAVAGRDETSPPQIWATANGADLGEPTSELYDGARMVHINTLKEMGADGIRIDAGYYRISPSPDAKTVAKFSGDD